ncbi:MAG: hypothetical protein U9Q81_07385 [Pseudomonadota bacterium]|nr:hypothetical protein [Pseudomonadota bacterium]
MKRTALYLVVLPVVVASPPALCDEASLEELKQRCEQAREREIAPLRQAAIEECVSSRRSTRTRDDCERIHDGFGEGGGTATGGFRARMFNDLPECLEYFQAQDEGGSSRSRR